MWANKTRILHHDNALTHTSLSLKQFLVSKQIIILNHQPYSLDHAFCDFFLFKKLKGACFQGVDDIKTNVTAHIKSIKKGNVKSASELGQEGWQNVQKPMAKILKMTVTGYIRAALGIQDELWLLCILANF